MESEDQNATIRTVAALFAIRDTEKLLTRNILGRTAVDIQNQVTTLQEALIKTHQAAAELLGAVRAAELSQQILTTRRTSSEGPSDAGTSLEKVRNSGMKRMMTWSCPEANCVHRNLRVSVFHTLQKA